MEILTGITLNYWIKIFKENRISLKHFLPALFLTFKSLHNTKFCKKEQQIYNKELAAIKLEHDPIFILGHWRSGTTLLHNFLSLDERFAYPNLFEVYNPFTFLYLEPLLADKLEKVGSQKRPMDNVRVDYKTPAEDEFALAVLSLKSPVLGWCFPKREDYYDKYLTFENAGETDITEWKNALEKFVRKLTLKYNRQLILKSPPHTARIKLLLDIFPNAKFIHIHRNPYKVFLSTENLYTNVVRRMYMQNIGRNNHNTVDGILNRYKIMYDRYFDDKKSIPKDRLVELSFEQFAKDPINNLKEVYSKLNLPDFEKVKPKFVEYSESISNYKKNKYNGISDELRDKISQSWSKSFKEWGYEI